MSDEIGRVGWSPDYKHQPKIVRPKRVITWGRSFECCRCGACEMNLVGQEPSKDWRWRDDGWICGECAAKEHDT